MWMWLVTSARLAAHIAPAARSSAEQHVLAEGVGIEQIRGEPDGVGEVNELIVEGLPGDVAKDAHPERDVGRSACSPAPR